MLQVFFLNFSSQKQQTHIEEPLHNSNPHGSAAAKGRPGAQTDARPGARQPSTGLPAATTAAGASTEPPSGKSQRWSTPTPGPSTTRLARDRQKEKQRDRHRSRRKLCLSRTTHLLFTAHKFLSGVLHCAGQLKKVLQNAELWVQH